MGIRNAGVGLGHIWRKSVSSRGNKVLRETVRVSSSREHWGVKNV